MKLHRRSFLMAAGLAAGAALLRPLRAASTAHEPLIQPSEMRSENGVLNATLRAAAGRVQLGDYAFPGLLYNDSYLPPLLRVQLGDTLRITFRNALADDPSNLHYHGMSVSPQGNSDNVFVHVHPGGQFEYAVHIPAAGRHGSFSSSTQSWARLKSSRSMARSTRWCRSAPERCSSGASAISAPRRFSSSALKACLFTSSPPMATRYRARARCQSFSSARASGSTRSRSGRDPANTRCAPFHSRTKPGKNRRRAASSRRSCVPDPAPRAYARKPRFWTSASSTRRGSTKYARPGSLAVAR